ncbi:hypothetical protein L6452_17752 [Arctium lappa]|uniref:Uncharacterized protein n=1 Tax=Arctium lappa TaxID=4217 RepID=A0ACB9C4E9_ARCLA|nr:hypothetical protein L6452_17752 [Arctium lappa]
MGAEATVDTYKEFTALADTGSPNLPNLMCSRMVLLWNNLSTSSFAHLESNLQGTRQYKNAFVGGILSILASDINLYSSLLFKRIVRRDADRLVLQN